MSNVTPPTGAGRGGLTVKVIVELCLHYPQPTETLLIRKTGRHSTAAWGEKKSSPLNRRLPRRIKNQSNESRKLPRFPY